jgi:hypothetical protein
MSERTNINEHLRSIGSLTTQLANIGIVVADDELVDLVLTSLPPSWSVFRQTMTGKENPSNFSDLESLLLLEDSVHTIHQEQEEHEEAMNV